MLFKIRIKMVRILVYVTFGSVKDHLSLKCEEKTCDFNVSHVKSITTFAVETFLSLQNLLSFKKHQHKQVENLHQEYLCNLKVWCQNKIPTWMLSLAWLVDIITEII